MKLIFETDGQYKIDVPFEVNAITFEGFCDFRSDEYLYLSAHSESEPVENFLLLQQAVQHIVKGDVLALPLIHDKTDAQLIDTDYTLQLDEPISLLRLYAHLLTVIRNYQPVEIPTTFKFKWGKKDFVIQQVPAARVLLGNPITLGEVLETLEYQRRAATYMEATPKEVGNISFNLGLTEFAILVKQAGELLPSNKAERRQFIESRKKLFATLPLNLVLDIRFFLTNSLLIHGQTLPTNSFGKVAQAVKRSKKVTLIGKWKNVQRRLGLFRAGVFTTRMH